MSSTAKVHYVASPRDIAINRFVFILMICTLVASLTIVIMQFGVINRLVDRLDKPARPPQIIRLMTPSGPDLICTLQPGSSNDAPFYKCTEE